MQEAVRVLGWTPDVWTVAGVIGTWVYNALTFGILLVSGIAIWHSISSSRRQTESEARPFLCLIPDRREPVGAPGSIGYSTFARYPIWRLRNFGRGVAITVRGRAIPDSDEQVKFFAVAVSAGSSGTVAIDRNPQYTGVIEITCADALTNRHWWHVMVTQEEKGPGFEMIDFGTGPAPGAPRDTPMA